MRYNQDLFKRKGHDYEVKCFMESNEMEWFYFHASSMYEAYQIAQGFEGVAYIIEIDEITHVDTIWVSKY